MVVLGFLFPAQKWAIWGCMVAAACPDLIWAYYKFYIEHIKKQKPRYDIATRFHYRVQWFQQPIGAAVEVGWFILMWTIIIFIKQP